MCQDYICELKQLWNEQDCWTSYMPCLDSALKVIRSVINKFISGTDRQVLKSNSADHLIETKNKFPWEWLVMKATITLMEKNVHRKSTVSSVYKWVMMIVSLHKIWHSHVSEDVNVGLLGCNAIWIIQCYSTEDQHWQLVYYSVIELQLKYTCNLY
jgi:hypothetical protein